MSESPAFYSKSARYYDVLYEAQGKNYEQESQQIHDLIQHNKQTSGNTLLDIGCGTGNHLAFLKQYYAVEGLDGDPEMLAIARQRLPDVTLHQGNMMDFDLGKQFDVLVCLFSAIGYVKTVPNLNQTLATMARHLKPGGVLIIEPWLPPDGYMTGHMHVLVVDKPDLKIVRMNRSERNGDLSILDFHFLVGTVQGIEYFTECHEVGLFTEAEYRAAFENSGLQVTFTAGGLTGRGLYIGVAAPQ